MLNPLLFIAEKTAASIMSSWDIPEASDMSGMEEILISDEVEALIDGVAVVSLLARCCELLAACDGGVSSTLLSFEQLAAQIPCRRMTSETASSSKSSRLTLKDFLRFLPGAAPVASRILLIELSVMPRMMPFNCNGCRFDLFEIEIRCYRSEP